MVALKKKYKKLPVNFPEYQSYCDVINGDGSRRVPVENVGVVDGGRHVPVENVGVVDGGRRVLQRFGRCEVSLYSSRNTIILLFYLICINHFKKCIFICT